MQASQVSEPTSSAEVIARYSAARKRIDQAGAVYAALSGTSAAPLPVLLPAAPLAPAASASVVGSPVNSALTFRSFLQGTSNRLAVAAALEASCSTIGQFNPLVIHGGSGYGKTHLLQAIANAQPEHSVYMTTDWLVANSTVARSAAASAENNIIVIDDIQSIRTKSAQADLLAVMTSSADRQKQIVVALDRSPIELDFEQRIASRLAGGLVIEIARHDRDLRFQLLKRRFAEAKRSRRSLVISDACLNYMADEIKSGGRDLDGVVNHLVAKASLEGIEIGMEMVASTISELIKAPEPYRVRIEDIQRVVARRYNVSRSDILSARRTANVVRPRQIAAYLAKELTHRSLPEIGRRFGGRDHTTILHAVRKMADLEAKDEIFASEIQHLKSVLTEPA